MFLNLFGIRYIRYRTQRGVFDSDYLFKKRSSIDFSISLTLILTHVKGFGFGLFIVVDNKYWNLYGAYLAVDKQEIVTIDSWMCGRGASKTNRDTSNVIGMV